MTKVTKVEFFTVDIYDRPTDLNRTVECPEGKIYVEWKSLGDGAGVALIRVTMDNETGFYLSGRFFKRMKIYFENGYVWDTLLKKTPEWRKMIYDELKQYADSDYEELLGEDHQTEMARAARLLDDEMQYEI